MSKQGVRQSPLPKSVKAPALAAAICGFLSLVFWFLELPVVDTTDWPEKMWLNHWDNHKLELNCRDFFMLLSLVLFVLAAVRLARNRKKKVSP
jgi:hypothetical protein